MSLYFKDLRASLGGSISLHPVSRNGVLFCASLPASVAFLDDSHSDYGERVGLGQCCEGRVTNSSL